MLHPCYNTWCTEHQRELSTTVKISNRLCIPCFGPLLLSCTDAPEHEDGGQAARWALLGYAKDGSRPAATAAAALATLQVDRHKGVPEKGAELLHTLLNTCIGVGSMGGALVCCWYRPWVGLRDCPLALSSSSGSVCFASMGWKLGPSL
jgi:hypothetical protein